MAKKHHWKKSVRAQVAAVLQNQRPSSSPTSAVAGGAATNAAVSGSTQTFPTHSLADIKHLGVTAVVLVVLLTAAVITDDRTHWLDRLAEQAANRWSRAATPPPPATSAAATNPTPTPVN